MLCYLSLHFILFWVDIFFSWLGLTIVAIVITLHSPSFFFTETSRSDGSKLCRNVLLIYIIRKCDFGVNLIFNNSSRTCNEISLTETLSSGENCILAFFHECSLPRNHSSLEYFVISWVVKYIDLLPCSYWGVLDKTLCDDVSQWIRAGFFWVPWNPLPIKIAKISLRVAMHLHNSNTIWHYNF